MHICSFQILSYLFIPFNIIDKKLKIILLLEHNLVSTCVFFLLHYSKTILIKHKEKFLIFIFFPVEYDFNFNQEKLKIKYIWT